MWNSTPSILDLPTTTNDRLVERNVSDAAIVSEPAGPRFATVGDLARALNRLDRSALELAARDPEPGILIEGPMVRKLVGAVWFRSIFPKLSSSWRERLLDALAGSAVIPNHVLSHGRQPIHLADGSHEDLKAIAATTAVSGAAGSDLHLVLAIVGLWGLEARSRLRFVDVAAPERSSRLGALFGMRRP